MLARSGRLPGGGDYSFEVKWDGFHAIVSTEGSLRVRSRRGWDMTPHVGFLANCRSEREPSPTTVQQCAAGPGEDHCNDEANKEPDDCACPHITEPAPGLGCKHRTDVCARDEASDASEEGGEATDSPTDPRERVEFVLDRLLLGGHRRHSDPPARF
jgi:hypothetical protein